MRLASPLAALLLGLVAGLWAVLVAAEEVLWPVALERADGVSVQFTLARAASPHSREQGLMGRRELAAKQGMIFDFGADDFIVMWMKDTFVSLDMLFISAAGALVDIQYNTTVRSESLLPGKLPARYVIEINAGEARQFGLVPGARLRLPANFPTGP